MSAPRITRFTWNFGSENGNDEIHVELSCLAGQGPHKPPTDWWAIRCFGRCLGRNGEWEWEPQPSSRTPDFLVRCRFTLEEALAMAAEAGPLQ